MSLNTFGHVFRVTTWGESHGPALGATVDGCPPGVPVDEAFLQQWLDKRRPGQSKHTTQRKEPDAVKILSGVFEGKTTGTPVQLMIENTDQRSKDYGEIAQTFRPGHADITYHQKYGVRDYRGGGRSSARETAARVAAGGLARAALNALAPGLEITGYMTRMGEMEIDRARFDWETIAQNDFWMPDAEALPDWEKYLQEIRKGQNSVGAEIEVACSPAEACEAYADLESFPQFVPLLKCVRVLGGGRSEWELQLPGIVTGFVRVVGIEWWPRRTFRCEESLRAPSESKSRTRNAFA